MSPELGTVGLISSCSQTTHVLFDQNSEIVYTLIKHTKVTFLNGANSVTQLTRFIFNKTL